MDVKAVTTTDGETSSTIAFDGDLSDDVKSEIGDYLLEQILLKVAAKTSPVDGSRFPALSKEYKKKKQEENLPGVPDLQESGEMLDDLRYELTADGLTIGVYGEAALRADGHNNLSGASDLPLRQFLPNVGEGFTDAIESEVARIIADAQGTDVSQAEAEAEFGDVESKADLYQALASIFTGLESRSELKLAALRSPEIYDALVESGAIEWL